MNEPICWRYALPNVNYSGWAVAHLDSRGFFSVVGDYGEYGYLWRNFGDIDFRVFLAKLGPDYLMGKLAERSELDRQETVHALRRDVCEDRRRGLLTHNEARDDWDVLDSFEGDSTYSAGWLLEELNLENADECFVMTIRPG